ncbi:MAG: DUF4136 domain-containing protein [Rubrivivax sp.]|nr:DUF4136 domain-containing protein [Rubrivivax sp.]MDH5338200.1 DUF4136 domain-containing protein [Rubrivivax sp.]
MRKALVLCCVATLLTGCAALNTVKVDIATYGEWPAGRSPGSFAFDRLPSQQAQPELAAHLEDLARPGLGKAGFVETAPGQAPDVLVQVAARSALAEPMLWADSLWWRGGWGYPHYRSPYYWGGPGPWGYSRWYVDPYLDRRYVAEVALLIRDAATGKPLYEARASNEGFGSGDDALSMALFETALFDFPRTGPNPRQLSVQIR